MWNINNSVFRKQWHYTFSFVGYVWTIRGCVYLCDLMLLMFLICIVFMYERNKQNKKTTSSAFFEIYFATIETNRSGTNNK